MPDNLDHIITLILAMYEATFRDLDETDPGRLKRFQISMRNGATVLVEFTRLDSLLARITPGETAFHDATDWNKLVIRFAGNPKLDVRFRGSEQVVNGFVAGNWQQRFGPDHLPQAASC